MIMDSYIVDKVYSLDVITITIFLIKNFKILRTILYKSDKNIIITAKVELEADTPNSQTNLHKY